jgi:hypothetical protein
LVLLQPGGIQVSDTLRSLCPITACKDLINPVFVEFVDNKKAPQYRANYDFFAIVNLIFLSPFEHYPKLVACIN